MNNEHTIWWRRLTAISSLMRCEAAFGFQQVKSEEKNRVLSNAINFYQKSKLDNFSKDFLKIEISSSEWE